MKFTKPLLLRELTPRLFRIFLVASIGAMNFGFDNSWWSGVNSMDTFIQDYGKYNGPGQERTLPSSWLSAASGTPIAGWIIGCILAGQLTGRLGRKWTIVVVCVIAIIGMIIQAAVLNFWALMVGRLINAFSMGIEANCVPMYMAELAPASIRGGLVNFYQTWLIVGAIAASGTILGCSETLTGMWTYRTVIIVQFAPPLMLICAVWTIPESPRWLLSKGRKPQALAAMKYMLAGTPTANEVEQELELMDRAMQEQIETHRASTYLDCFKGSNLHRTVIAVGVQVLQQAQGNSFMQSYVVLFLQQLGVSQPLVINLARGCTTLAGALFMFYLSDKVGRRPLMFWGAFFMWALMWIVSGLNAWGGDLNNTAAQGIVAAILIYGAFAASCWGAVMWTVTAEVATAQLRERTIAIATTIGFCTSLLITYINPFVQGEPGNLGAKVGFVYGSMSLVAMAFVYLVVPETKGRSLEELDELFQAKVPAWKASKYVCTGIGAAITQVEQHTTDTHDLTYGKLAKETIVTTQPEPTKD